MKVNRMQNGSFEAAKEPAENLSRVAIAAPARFRKSSSTPCATPERAPVRRRAKPTGKRPTTITAKIDVGFGNSLSIRGEGAGLSWEKGEPLLCVDGSTWVWSRPAASEPVTFKLLLNDQVWCGGQNFTAAAGEHAQVIPVF